jgi:hypothetical protein
MEYIVGVTLALRRTRQERVQQMAGLGVKP